MFLLMQCVITRWRRAREVGSFVLCPQLYSVYFYFLLLAKCFKILRVSPWKLVFCFLGFLFIFERVAIFFCFGYPLPLGGYDILLATSSSFYPSCCNVDFTSKLKLPLMFKTEKIFSVLETSQTVLTGQCLCKSSLNPLYILLPGLCCISSHVWVFALMSTLSCRLLTVMSQLPW